MYLYRRTMKHTYKVQFCLMFQRVRDGETDKRTDSDIKADTQRAHAYL